MAKLTTPLTNTQVKQAKPKDKEYKLSDSGGLQLRVKPSGSKTWIFNYYKPVTKKRTALGFGQYPSVSIADARILRDEARALLSRAVDPKEHKDDKDRQKSLEADHTFSGNKTGNETSQ